MLYSIYFRKLVASELFIINVTWSRNERHKVLLINNFQLFAYENCICALSIER